MGILKFASAETKRIELDGGDWLDVKTDLSKRVFNELLAAMPNREITEESKMTLSEGLVFAEALFKALVVGWSAPEEVSVENYLELDNSAASAIDAVLVEHFGTLTPSAEEQSKVSTSRGSRQRAKEPTR